MSSKKILNDEDICFLINILEAVTNEYIKELCEESKTIKINDQEFALNNNFEYIEEFLFHLEKTSLIAKKFKSFTSSKEQKRLEQYSKQCQAITEQLYKITIVDLSSL